MKTCNKCGETKPIREFGIYRHNGVYKHRGTCLQCARDKQRERRKAQPRNVVYIYALVDPRDNQRRYVGQTSMPKTRLNGHVSEARCGYTNDSKVEWITILLSCGLKPTMEILEETTPNLANERERHWFEALTCEGCDLLNIDRSVGAYKYTWR